MTNREPVQFSDQTSRFTQQHYYCTSYRTRHGRTEQADKIQRKLKAEFLQSTHFFVLILLLFLKFTCVKPPSGLVLHFFCFHGFSTRPFVVTIPVWIIWILVLTGNQNSCTELIWPVLCWWKITSWISWQTKVTYPTDLVIWRSDKGKNLF